MLELLEKARPFLESTGVSFPIVVDCILLIGSARLIMKPLMSLIKAVVKQTPTVKDDEFLAKIMESKIYISAAAILDYLASIKLPKKEDQ